MQIISKTISFEYYKWVKSDIHFLLFSFPRCSVFNHLNKKSVLSTEAVQKFDPSRVLFLRKMVNTKMTHNKILVLLRNLYESYQTHRAALQYLIVSDLSKSFSNIQVRNPVPGSISPTSVWFSYISAKVKSLSVNTCK